MQTNQDITSKLKNCQQCGTLFKATHHYSKYCCQNCSASSKAFIRDINGEKYTRLLVIGYAGKKFGRHFWECLCDCGKTTSVDIYKLRNGTTRSCGCLSKEVHSVRCAKLNLKHGKSYTKEYSTWAGMRTRCLNVRSPSYPDYGGRGVKICSRWDTFQNFLADMGTAPSPQHSLDRIDNNGDYCLKNCRWATDFIQSNNRRNNLFVTFRGQRKALGIWCKELELNYQNTYRRIFKYGLDIESVLGVK